MYRCVHFIVFYFCLIFNFFCDGDLQRVAIDLGLRLQMSATNATPKFHVNYVLEDAFAYMYKDT